MRPKFCPLILAVIILLPSVIFGEKPTGKKSAIAEVAVPTIEQTSVLVEQEPLKNNTAKLESRTGEKIDWQVISSGGTNGTSTNYILNGTISQTAVDNGISSNYILHHGYWQEFSEAGPCDCEPGEADGAPPINILDIVYIINYKYKEGPAPVPYEVCSADPEIDCFVNILDVVYVINYKYKEGPPPPTCEEWQLVCGSLTKK